MNEKPHDNKPQCFGCPHYAYCGAVRDLDDFLGKWDMQLRNGPVDELYSRDVFRETLAKMCIGNCKVE